MSTANEFGKFMSYFACVLDIGVNVPVRQAAACMRILNVNKN